MNNNLHSITQSLDVIRNTVTSAANGAEQTSGATITQLDDILALLRVIQDQVSKRHAPSDAASQHDPLPQGSDSRLPEISDTTELTPQLSEAIDRLGKFRTREPEVIREDEAEAIIVDLECLLTAICDAYTKNSVLLRKTRTNDVETEEITRRDVKKLCALLSAADALEVNQGRKWKPRLVADFSR